MPGHQQWPIKDIVYVAIVGTVMVAALLEWILWLLAFVYCLMKVFRKANGKGRHSIRVLVVLNTLFFVAMRCIFLPIMIVTLPLPTQVVQYFTKELVNILQWFAFWAFAGLLTVPWLFCVYQLITHDIGRTRRIKTILNELSAPKVVVVLPCYNETPEILLRTIDSIVSCDYPTSCMHIFLSFDGAEENELYVNTIESLGVLPNLSTYPRSIDVTYRACRVTVSRFPHGGKRSCQKRTFRLIEKIYADYLRRNDNLFVLFIDSDCILDRYCVQNFMYEMELKPGARRTMLAMTGVITSTTTQNSIITLLQDMEYIHGQLFERAVESGCGAVTCLPGALTILRFSAFRRMAKYYFADKTEQCDDLFDYGKCHLGEDRWLTHLFMVGSKERYQIQMNTGAFCKTEAVQTFKSLLKQRRRWFLGFITNEACMLTDIRLWRRFPLLLIMRLAQNTIRTTALLFLILLISILSTAEKASNLPIGFLAVSLGLNWALMFYFGARLGRFKIMLYPLMFVINPLFNWTYMVYGIFTAGQRTWGGPRADAGKADEHTTPDQVVEQAERNGDDLNIVPETFNRNKNTMPVIPSERLQGRFTPAEELAGGWFHQINDSGVLAVRGRCDVESADSMSARARRGSSSSSVATMSDVSVSTPRRVESILTAAQARDYLAQQLERVAATSHPPDINAPGSTDNRGATNGDLAVSVHSAVSDSSISLHFEIPCRNATMPTSTPPETLCLSEDFRTPPTRPVAPIDPGPALSRPTRATSVGPGQSPLARKSFTRIASPPHEGPANVAHMSAIEVIELERRAAAQAAVELDHRGRRPSTERRARRLSKR